MSDEEAKGIRKAIAEIQLTLKVILLMLPPEE